MITDVEPFVLGWDLGFDIFKACKVLGMSYCPEIDDKKHKTQTHLKVQCGIAMELSVLELETGWNQLMAQLETREASGKLTRILDSSQRQDSLLRT